MSVQAKRTHQTGSAAASTSDEDGDTRTRILDVGEKLLLERGYAGFSYQDIAEAVGIRKASIHHHFPAKEDLGAAIVERARVRVAKGRGPALEDADYARRQLDVFFKFFERLAEEGTKLCLGGRLSADYAVLPQGVRDPFRDFMTDHAEWLTAVCQVGQRSGAFVRDMSPADQALMLRSAVQGAVQLSRAKGDPTLFQRVARHLRKQVLVSS